MEKVRCGIIQDLLPLYVDNITSEDSNEIINEHVKECKECSEFLESIKYDEGDLQISNILEEDDEIQKRLMKNINRNIVTRNLLFTMIGAVLSIFIVRGEQLYLMFILVPVVSGFIYYCTKKLWVAPVVVGFLRLIYKVIWLFSSETSKKVPTSFKAIVISISIFVLFSFIGSVIGYLIESLYIKKER